ncbi:MAG: sulfur globule protein precursor, partial [Bradyrhizobium sp.]|nr:sulfur globule protein precursor [Bradyrhizobium sp.]
MLRKLSLAAVAAVSLGAAALAPTAASAHWHGGWHHGWHGGWHGGYYGWHR